MVGIVILTVLVLCIGSIAWMRWRHKQAYAISASPEDIPRQIQAPKAFMQGNSYLAEGKFSEALAAFQQTRAFDPKHPYVADRIAEAERRQQAASATLLADTTV